MAWTVRFKQQPVDQIAHREMSKPWILPSYDEVHFWGSLTVKPKANKLRSFACLSATSIVSSACTVGRLICSKLSLYRHSMSDDQPITWLSIQSTNHLSDRVKRIICSPKGQERLRGPHSLLLKGEQGLYSRGKTAEHSPTSVAFTPTPPHTHPCVHRDSVTCTLT